MSSGEEFKGERQFLHDVSNVIAITQGHLHLLIRKIEKNPNEIKIEDVSAKLQGIMSSVNRMIELLQARRDVVRQSSEDKSA